MKCETCRFNGNTEYDKPCIIRREDCELYEEVEDLTPNEAIERLEQMIKWGDTYEVDEDACKLAIKALKQYGALQEIRQEIEKPLRDERCFDTADAKAQYIALNWVCELIDKHIKEYTE